MVECIAEDLGLQLNRGKSEVIAHDSCSLEPLLAIALALTVTSPKFLGSPLGNAESVSRSIGEKTEKLKVMGDRLQYLHAHDTILLLRHALAILKLLYTLCTSPCYACFSGATYIVTYDNVLRAITSRVTNTHFGEQDSSCIDPGLPSCEAGGLGNRSSAALTFCFLSFCSCLLQPCPTNPARPLARDSLPIREESLAAWRDDSNPPSDPAPHRQEYWDLPKVHETSVSLLEKAQS